MGRIYSYFLIVPASVLFVVLLTSCGFEGKLSVKWMDSHKGASSSYCESRFPVKSVFKEGKIQTITDTVINKYDSIIVSDTCLGKITKKVINTPVFKIITHTKIKIDTAFIKDSALVIYEKYKSDSSIRVINNLNKDLEHNKNVKKTATWMAVLGWSIILVAILTWVTVKFKII